MFYILNKKGYKSKKIITSDIFVIGSEKMSTESIFQYKIHDILQLVWLMFYFIFKL